MNLERYTVYYRPAYLYSNQPSLKYECAALNPAQAIDQCRTMFPDSEIAHVKRTGIDAELIKVYRFMLMDRGGNPAMFTEVDECDPRADLEFWELFMTGEFVMAYTGQSYEEITIQEIRQAIEGD